MKKTTFLFAALISCSVMFAAEVPIQAKKNTEMPASFYVASPIKTGVSCIKNNDGRYILRIDAKDAMKKLISGSRIKLEQGDTLTLKLKLKVRTGGVIASGFYIYDGKAKYLTALYNHSMALTPEKTDYTFSGIVQKNPKAVSAFERPAMGLVFFDAKKGCEFDIEKIEYEIKKAPEAKAVIPEF